MDENLNKHMQYSHKHVQHRWLRPVLSNCMALKTSSGICTHHMGLSSDWFFSCWHLNIQARQSTRSGYSWWSKSLLSYSPVNPSLLSSKHSHTHRKHSLTDLMQSLNPLPTASHSKSYRNTSLVCTVWTAFGQLHLADSHEGQQSDRSPGIVWGENHALWWLLGDKPLFK